MDRRSVLKGAGLAVAGGFLLPRSASLRADAAGAEPLRDLPEVRSTGGVLDAQLDMVARTLRVGERPVTLDTYSGQFPGPIFRFRPGERVRLLSRNRMRPMGIPANTLPPMCASHPGEHGTTAPPHGPLECAPHVAGQVAAGETLPQMMLATNIHTHGLQVSPEDAADNVFVRVDPLGQHQYVYDIPDDQPAGLHWYHPHFHGSTSHQGWAGLSGPLIVEGDVDEVPELADMRERTIVINELWLDEDGEVPTALVVPTGGLVPFSSIPAGAHHDDVHPERAAAARGPHAARGDPALADAQRLTAPGDLAAHRRHPLHQIGVDGVPLARTKQVPATMLSAGNRTEFVLRAGSRPGRYPIVARRYDQGHPGGARPTVQLGTLVVTGPPATGRIPTTLVTPPRMPQSPIARRRTLVFSGDITGASGIGVRFFIDDKLYDHHRIDQTVEAGTVEEWRLVNDDVFQHPFHIHVNPFQVIDVTGIPPGDPSWNTDPSVWWDVFRLPPKGEVTIRIHFRPDITGKTVYHCHILPHEDNGMMGNVLITPPGEGS